MRICIITKYLPPEKTDGIPRNRWEYAKQFAKSGHEVHIVTSGDAGAEEIRDNIFIHKIAIFDQAIFNKYYRDLSIMEHAKHVLCFSHLIYLRIKELNDLIGIDIIDAPLWDIEGYITKLLLPGIAMAVRLESTTMLIREIRNGVVPLKEDQNELETHFLNIADAYVFDSWSIFKETERLYQVDLSRKPSAMIYHGIELEPYKPYTKRIKNSNRFNVIVVGRLEKRKGTDILVREILPVALRAIDNIEFHFVGFDNAQWDGFKESTGLFYTAYIQKHFAEYVGKNIFIHGYVDDTTLNKLYDSADCVLGLSRYESFGLLYVEAMQKGKPLVVFDTGAVPELFEDGKDALIIPLEQPLKVVDALKRIRDEEGLVDKLVQQAREKLYKRFSAERMGKECSAFFEKLIFETPGQRLFQVMNALSDKDGASNITVDYDTFFRKEGIVTQVLGTWATKLVEDVQKPIESVVFNNQDIILYHYWNYCDRAEYFNNLNSGRKVFLFHNMTSPSFFEKGDEAYETTTKGFHQLKSLDNFDLYVGFSAYSIKILEQSIRVPIKTFILPPLIDASVITKRPHLISLVEKIKIKDVFTILFVGRICSNKKQTDLIRFFHYYLNQKHTNAQLILVGGGHDKFIDNIKVLIHELGLEDKVILTGKITDEELYSYYRVSDLYLSMSEHEGFGVPLTEAMAFEIPVVAFNCTSIEDTVGDNGCLFVRKDNELISVLIDRLRTDISFRNTVIEKQNLQMQKFSVQNVRQAFAEMEQVLHEQFAKRGAERNDDRNKTQIISFDNDNIIKEGAWEYRKDGFIKFETGNVASCIIVDAEFESFDVTLLMHEWSGKGRLLVDDIYVEEFDLFSSEWKIETLSFEMKLPHGPHRIIIEALDERNVDSKGFEILFKNIVLYSTSTQPSVGKTSVKNTVSEMPSAIDAIFKRPKNAVCLQETKNSIEQTFKYSGEWLLKDEHYMYAEGNMGLNECYFELAFSELEVMFLAHAWSGMVKVIVDDSYTEVINLYSEQPSMRQIKLSKFFTEESHSVVIVPLNEKHKNSHAYQVFFKEITIYNYISVKVDEDTLANNYKVSINVNTMNRAPYLEALLKAFENQTYKYFEVVVVNGPSTDYTELLLERYKDRIKVAQCPDANLTHSRNIGIENSAGNFIAYIDDDAIPGDQFWLENYIYYLIWRKNDNIGAMGGPVKHRDTNFFEYKNGISSDYAVQVFDEAYLNGEQIDGDKWFYRVCGCNNIMSKTALYQIGGFDERMFHYLDETDVCLQMWRNGFIIENHPLNYVRHYKATNEYRKSDINIRWDIISRSDTFFSLKNGRNWFPYRIVKMITLFSGKHFYKEIYSLYKNEKIDKQTFNIYKKLLWRGFWEGLKWGIFQKPKKNFLNKKSNDFKQFNLVDNINEIVDVKIKSIAS